LWLPAIGFLVLFAWLLTLHPSTAGGMYITVALLWLYWVEGINLTRWDIAGAGLALAGMAVIMLQPRI